VLEEEQLVENAQRQGELLLARFRRLQERSKWIGEVRGRGLMIGIELVHDRKTKEPASDKAKALRAALRERGVLVGVGGTLGNVLRVQPPLSITDAECDQAAAAIEDVLTS
jgi:4-aminobutyrate aminotransferase-like enzyme